MAYRAALREWELDLPAHQQRLASLPAAVSNDVVMAAIERVESYFAENLMQQGRLLEAEMAARGLIRKTLTRTGRYSPDTGNAVWTLARVIAEQGRYREATMLARAALESHERAGAAPQSYFFASARRNYAGMLVAEEKWEPALFEYEKLRDALSKDAFLSERLAAGDIDWALALMRTGKADSAVAMLGQLLAKSVQNLGEIHYQTAEVRGFYAMALSQKGERERAYREFAKAIAVFVSGASADFDQEAGALGRSRRLRLIIEAYVALLADLHDTPFAKTTGVDLAAEAFRLADVARAQSVQRAVMASAARSAAANPTLAELVRHEQDTRQYIGARYELLNNMLAAPLDQQIPKVIADLKAQIEQARASRPALMKEIETRFPDYANLVNPKPASIDDAKAALRVGEALLSFFVTPERTFVWAAPKQGPVAFAAASVGEKEMAKSVSQLRKALEPGEVALGAIPAYNLAEAYKLYAQLLKPVEGGWKEAKSLIATANGALGQLPLALLPTEAVSVAPNQTLLFGEYKNVPWLIRKVAVTQVPSVNALVALRALPAGERERAAFAGFGDPVFGKARSVALAQAGTPTRMRNLSVVRVRTADKKPVDWIEYSQLTPLPDTAEELLAIAGALKADPNGDVFLGERATKRRVKTMDLSKRKVIAFATHGLLPGDFPGLTQPALALSLPENPEDKEGALLTLEDILTLKLNADWVVLSACNTAAGEGAGAEAVSGLGRAFFYAGSRALLVTHWPVETRSAKILVTNIFERYGADPALTRAEALRQAMLSLHDSPGYVDPGTKKIVFSFAHPIFWAPYALVGDGGR